jgi:hypothetical protein
MRGACARHIVRCKKNRIIFWHGVQAITTRDPAGEGDRRARPLGGGASRPRRIESGEAAWLLLDAAEVQNEWSGVLRTVRAGILAVPSRVAARLPHLTAHDVAEIDAEVRAVLAEIATS